MMVPFRWVITAVGCPSVSTHSSFRATHWTHPSLDDSCPDKRGDDQLHQSGVASLSIRSAGGIGSSPMSPSRMRMIRRMRLATRGSWVATRSVVPSQAQTGSRRNVSRDHVREEAMQVRADCSSNYAKCISGRKKKEGLGRWGNAPPDSST